MMPTRLNCSRIMSKRRRKKANPVTKVDPDVKILIIAFIAMCIGYFLLNYVATWEDPPLGNTFHIVMGCVIIAVSGLILFFTIKRKYFPKKKKKRSRPIFLD